MNKAIFLDRDGVINKLVDRGDKFTAPWYEHEWELLPNVKEALDIFRSMGYIILVVTNQPDPEANLSLFNEYLFQIGVDDIFNATTRGDEFYKPNNGSIEYFCRMYGIDRSLSYMIGDREKDIIAGINSNLNTILINSDLWCDTMADDVCLHLMGAVESIKNWDENKEFLGHD